jgi:hypothetical protein
LPAQLAEAQRDLVVQVQRVGDQEPQANGDRHQHPAGEASAPAAAFAGIVKRIVLVFVVPVLGIMIDVLVSGHSGGNRACRRGGCENTAMRV